MSNDPTTATGETVWRVPLLTARNDDDADDTGDSVLVSAASIADALQLVHDAKLVVDRSRPVEPVRDAPSRERVHEPTLDEVDAALGDDVCAWPDGLIDRANLHPTLAAVIRSASRWLLARAEDAEAPLYATDPASGGGASAGLPQAANDAARTLDQLLLGDWPDCPIAAYTIAVKAVLWIRQHGWSAFCEELDRLANDHHDDPIAELKG